MSVLKDHFSEIKITPTNLKLEGFWRDGWGSPNTRKERNTNMYEALIEDEENFTTLHVMWFPKKFEGWVNLGLHRVDVRGRCVIDIDNVSNRYWISPVLRTMEDLHTFISLVQNEQIEPTNVYKLQNWTDHGYSVD